MPERLTWFRLAITLGCTVREAQARIDSREFAEWIAYMRIEPTHSDKSDWQTAHIVYALASIYGKTSAKIDDYKLKYGSYNPDPVDKLKAILGGKNV